jgi:hypothetical protein
MPCLLFYGRDSHNNPAIYFIPMCHRNVKPFPGLNVGFMIIFKFAVMSRSALAYTLKGGQWAKRLASLIEWGYSPIV